MYKILIRQNLRLDLSLSVFGRHICVFSITASCPYYTVKVNMAVAQLLELYNFTKNKFSVINQILHGVYVDADLIAN